MGTTTYHEEDRIDRDAWEPQGVHFALVFSHEEMLSTPAFKARAEIHGRLLAIVREDGSCCVDGVNPGALVVEAPSFADAEPLLRKALAEILEDIALASDDIEMFRVQVDDFMKTTDEETVRKWMEARSGPVRSAPLGGHRQAEWYIPEMLTGQQVLASSKWHESSIHKPSDSVYLANAAPTR